MEMKREKMETHEDDDKFYFHMALEAVVKFQDAKTKLQDTCTSTCNHYHNCKPQISMKS